MATLVVSRVLMGSLAAGTAVSDLAHKQVAQHLGIPAPYYVRLRSEYPALLDSNVNTLLAATPEGERRMVRTIGGMARAFLSDRYRRLDNFDLLEAILPTLMEMPGLEIASCDVTEQKLYLKVTTSRIQAEVQPGDVVQSGLAVSNSEVGLEQYPCSPTRSDWYASTEQFTATSAHAATMLAASSPTQERSLQAVR